jgi:hypothetical protein
MQNTSFAFRDLYELPGPGKVGTHLNKKKSKEKKDSKKKARKFQQENMHK